VETCRRCGTRLEHAQRVCHGCGNVAIASEPLTEPSASACGRGVKQHASAPAAKVVMQRGAWKKEIELHGQQVRIGRADDNDFVIPAPFLAQHHALIEFDGTHYRIVDVSGWQGLLSRGRFVPSAVLRAGFTVRIGDRESNLIQLTLYETEEEQMSDEPPPPDVPRPAPSEAGPPPVAPPPRRRSRRPSSGGHVWPAWLISGALFLLLELGFVLLVTRFIAPAVLGASPINNLQSAVSDVTTLFASCSLAAGFLAAVVGSSIATSGRRHRARTVFIGGVAGPLAVAGAFVGFAWLPKGSAQVSASAATPLTSIVVNIALVMVGAALGSFLVLWFRRRPPAPTIFAVVGLAGSIALVAILCNPSLPAQADTVPYQDMETSGCTLGSVEDSASASLTLFSIELGPAFSFKESHTADGKWHVDVAEGATGGITLSFGEKLGNVGANMDVSASSHLTLTIMNSYEFPSRTQASFEIRRAPSLYLGDVAALPGVSELLKDVLGDVDSPGNFEPPPLKKSELRLAGDVSLDAQLGTQDYKLGITVGDAVSVELDADSTTPSGSQAGLGSSFVSDPSKVKVGIDLNAALTAGAGASLELNGDGELWFGIAKQGSVLGVDLWRPDSVGLNTTAELTAGAQAQLTLEGIKSFLGKGKGTAGGGAAGDDSRAQSSFLKELNINLTATQALTVEADFTANGADSHPRTFAALAEFLVAVAPDFQGKKADSAAASRAGDDLAAAFAQEADVGITGYHVRKIEGDFEISVGGEFTFGASAKLGRAQEDLLSALYRINGSELSASVNCVPLQSP
jgi:FHA domain